MNHEQQPLHENNHEHLTLHEAEEHRERLKQLHEKAGEAPDQTSEHLQAKHEAERLAISGAELHRPQAEKPQTFAPTRQADKDQSFETTMKQVRQNMSAPERAFSKFVHQPAIEKTSEVLGKTIARPSGIAGGTIAAFIGLLSVYGIARFAGFELSGSEMPLLLAIGFVAGVLLEWIIKVLRSIFAPKSFKSEA